MAQNLYVVEFLYKDFSFEELCFRAPDFFSLLDVGNAGILDAMFWLRDIKKSEEFSRPYKKGNLPYLMLTRIDKEDIGSSDGRHLILNKDVTSRALDERRIIGVDKQDSLGAVLDFLYRINNEEGFDLRSPSWDDYKDWKENKIKELKEKHGN